MAAYYNENDPRAAAWLRELIAKGLIADGEVDERSIVDVLPEDLRGFRQVHLFAGIGGWSLALRLAGWPDSREVWTGSPPCQPFSAAGKNLGVKDERHLWPEMYRLVAASKPPAIFGEQVASKAGREWFAAVRADLEGMGYAVGGADLCAAGIGAPHIRQRLYWMAHASGERREGQRVLLRGEARGRLEAEVLETAGGCGASGSGAMHGGWGVADWLYCRDGKWRPVEPGTFPLADGIPARVGRLRGYGNAIVPQLAAEVIGAYRDIFDS